MTSNSAEIVLLHDQNDTTDLFYKIVDQLLEMPIEIIEVTP